MIDGVKVEIKSEDFAALLQKRIEEYKKQLGSGTIVLIADEATKKKVTERIAYLTFIKEHLAKDQTYSLSVQDLVNTEIVFF